MATASVQLPPGNTVATIYIDLDNSSQLPPNAAGSSGQLKGTQADRHISRRTQSA